MFFLIFNVTLGSAELDQQPSPHALKFIYAGTSYELRTNGGVLTGFRCYGAELASG